ncbi:hypothetical protein [Acinetobacter baumannii]|uniref:hypothetical protein n=1 Tax=Acinetobacter baumannii TaxID=470 RepID=UPI0020C83E8F|nr:hypothetical protein [Acinetobacter baumannii]MCP9170984.1 hypothetical protein [Acinetobacter baumannii]MCP9205331.1 hypothetical protein [Acinetobacter baumannii]
MSYLFLSCTENIGQERPILILEHQQRIDAKLKEVVQQYKTDVVKQQVDNNW